MNNSLRVKSWRIRSWRIYFGAAPIVLAPTGQGRGRADIVVWEQRAEKSSPDQPCPSYLDISAPAQHQEDKLTKFGYSGGRSGCGLSRGSGYNPGPGKVVAACV